MTSPPLKTIENTAPWCMIMALWGEKYGAAHVNELAQSALLHSPSLQTVVLLTDHIRDGIDPRVTQKLFPAFFHRPAFFSGCYRVKLAVFSAEVLPPQMACVFVDLDTIITGDLGKIAALVSTPNQYFMMPPGGIGFSTLRRWIDRAKRGRSFPTGNSSLLAFHSAASPNLAESFQRRFESGTDVDARYMVVDDVFISWFARDRLAGLPTSLAVMFRREFLGHSLLLLRLRAKLGAVQRRRAEIVAITLNGAEYKPENLLALEDGAVIHDRKGRTGLWSDALFGPARAKIIESCQRIVSQSTKAT